MLLRSSLTLAGFALAACSSPEEVAERTGVQVSTGTDRAAAQAVASSAEGKSVKEETDLLSFEYSYPAAAAAIPELAELLDKKAQRARSEAVAQAREGREDFESDDIPFRQHSFSEDWQVVADLPGWLSLSGHFATYTGGAHGMYGLESLVWDKRRKVALDAIDLFASPAALDRALGQRLCDALNAEREERRGEPVPPVPDDADDFGFNSCQHVKEATVLVGSSNGQTFDRLTVWFGPYVAGSYAEGAYELDFAVDKAVHEAVKPAYRDAFSAQ